MIVDKVEKPVRVGVIGLGYWGPKLVRNLASLHGVEMAKASDLKVERLEDLKQKFPEIEVTKNYKDLLNDTVDAVVIATPVSTHYKLAKEALSVGKHVLLEKPFTRTSEQGQELIDLAKKNNCRLMVGHTFLYNPAIEEIRKIIMSGELGDIYYLNASRVNLGLLQPDINVMWDLAPHDLSILNYILNDDPTKVSAVGSVFINKSRNLHEVVYMNLRYKNNTIANLRVSWLDPFKMRRLTVVGSKKMLVFNDILEKKVILHDKGVEVPPYSLTEEEFSASYREGPETVVPITWTEPLKMECQHFIDCINSGTSPRSNGENGLKVIKILETAQRSLVNGGLELLIEY
jgi:predicted dehydrogenase